MFHDFDDHPIRYSEGPKATSYGITSTSNGMNTPMNPMMSMSYPNAITPTPDGPKNTGQNHHHRGADPTLYDIAVSPITPMKDPSKRVSIFQPGAVKKSDKSIQVRSHPTI